MQPVALPTEPPDSSTIIIIIIIIIIMVTIKLAFFLVKRHAMKMAGE
jgi:hypothetical protein